MFIKVLNRLLTSLHKEKNVPVQVSSPIHCARSMIKCRGSLLQGFCIKNKIKTHDTIFMTSKTKTRSISWIQHREWAASQCLLTFSQLIKPQSTNSTSEKRVNKINTSATTDITVYSTNGCIILRGAAQAHILYL